MITRMMHSECVLLSTSAMVQQCNTAFYATGHVTKQSTPWRTEATPLAVRRPFPGRTTSTESDAFASHIADPCLTDAPAFVLVTSFTLAFRTPKPPATFTFATTTIGATA